MNQSKITTQQNTDIVGKVCPYCKGLIAENSEVVICSACEMPHHRECWIENSGCTTFGCTGTMLEISSKPNDPLYRVDGKRFCPKCGTEVKPGQIYCVICGAELNHGQIVEKSINHYDELPPIDIEILSDPTPIKANNQPYQTTYQNTPPIISTSYNADVHSNQMDENQEIALFIRENSNYYLEKFHEMKVKGKTTSWNWSAFFFNIEWLLYRKMYNTAIAYLIGILVISFVPLLGGLMALGVGIYVGLNGNRLYQEYIMSELKVAKTLDLVQYGQYIQKKGGTSVGAVFAYLGIYALLLIIISVAFS